jgi:CMP-N,N'-diacetyllegionaminic acid synthase
MKIYAIIPARSGSKGVPHKNIRRLCGHELLGYSVAFAKSLDLDRVICSTDSPEYAEVAMRYGAEVPFLRSAAAAGDKSMEQDILQDLYAQFSKHGIVMPDLLVWLRPTFVFRDAASVRECIDRMIQEPALTACRVVVPSESRLYRVEQGMLHPTFPTHGRSMIRRQDVGTAFRVFCTDVFRASDTSVNFLGDRVGAVIGDKVCGVDVDDEFDLIVAEGIMRHMHSDLGRYLALAPVL